MEKKYFTGCASLKKVVVPCDLADVEGGVFAGCGVNDVTLSKSAYENFDKLFPNNFAKDIKHLALLDGVEQITQIGFGKCTSLKTLIIPSSATSIDSLAFQNCSNLKQVYLLTTDASNLTIGANAFGYMVEDSAIDIYEEISGLTDKLSGKYNTNNTRIIELDQDEMDFAITLRVTIQ